MEIAAPEDAAPCRDLNAGKRAGIPKGFCNKAQGCEQRATLGKLGQHSLSTSKRLRRLLVCLIPYVALIPFDVVLAEQCPQFILKAHFLVMLLLCRDVLRNLRQIRLADREVRIAALPLKIQVIATLLLQP